MLVTNDSKRSLKNSLTVPVFILLFVATLLEAGFVYYLLQENALLAFVAHLLSALLFPWAIRQVMPSKFHDQRLFLCLLWLYCFLIPVISGIGLFLALGINSHFSKPYIGEISETVIESELPEQLVQTMQLSSYEGGSLVGIVEASSISNQRIKAVLKTRKMIDRHSIPILRRALLDPVDEVRLLAYSMLDKKEKKLDRIINQLLMVIENNKDKPLVSEHMGLAEAYWELSYLGLVHGQAQLHILEDAYEHIQQVLKINQHNAEAYFLQARIALALNLYQVAEDSLDKALKFEISENKAKAYQYELAFVTRHFENKTNATSQPSDQSHLLNTNVGATENWG